MASVVDRASGFDILLAACAEREWICPPTPHSLSQIIFPFVANDVFFSLQSASVGGAAHLVNFQGTDTIASLIMARDYYGSSKIAGLSIPAAEHSTITSWTKDGETAAFRNMLTKVSLQPFLPAVYCCTNYMYMCM